MIDREQTSLEPDLPADMANPADGSVPNARAAPAGAADPVRWPHRPPGNRPQHLLELAGRALRANWGGIGLLSAERELVDHYTFGLGESSAAELRGSPWCHKLLDFILKHPVSVRVADLAAVQPQMVAPAGVGMPNVPAIGPFLGVPLSSHGRCQGAVYLTRLPGQPAFEPADEELVLPIREWFEQGTLFEEARLLARLRLLNEIAHAAAGSQDLASLLQIALRELDRHLPQHVSLIWLLEITKNRGSEEPPAGADSDVPLELLRIRLAASSATSHARAKKLGLLPGQRLKLEQTPFTASLLDGQALYCDLASLKEQKNLLANRLALRGASASFAVPLRMGKRTNGILQSVCTRSAGFTNEQIQLLYLVADMLGPAISNCQLIRRLRTANEELRRTQGQLIHAEKMRALGELASGVAHDFNNSLCGVLGFLELALTVKRQDPLTQNYLESARTCTLDAAQTVRRVQDFARWQRIEPALQSIDLNELVRETIQLTRHKWEGPAHLLDTAVTVDIRTEATERVSGNSTELREVLTNLVFNAVEAMPRGGKLGVRTWSTPTNLFLSVHDTGEGMDELVRRRLFEPFFTTKGERGNGLGLSVAFGIVQRYRGEIKVESEVGRGSVFTVRLPVLAGAKPAEPDTGSSRKRLGDPDPGSASAPASFPPQRADDNSIRTPPAMRLRILVIEDEESIRRFLESGLAQLGHSARLTADAEEGLTAFTEEHFDVVLTDLGLPGMSGEEVARLVARHSPATPVILLTGWSDQLRDEAGRMEGVTRILAKPVKLQTLASALTSVVSASCPA